MTKIHATKRNPIVVQDKNDIAPSHLHPDSNPNKLKMIP